MTHIKFWVATGNHSLTSTCDYYYYCWSLKARYTANIESAVLSQQDILHRARESQRWRHHLQTIPIGAMGHSFIIMDWVDKNNCPADHDHAMTIMMMISHSLIICLSSPVAKVEARAQNEIN